MPESQTTELVDLSTSRLDRWLKRHHPGLNQALIEKLLRQKKILLNGQKAKSSDRVGPQDEVSILNDLSSLSVEVPVEKKEIYQQKDIDFLQSLIIWEDEDLCVLNKPHGLAVQGGTKTLKHIDGLLRAYGRGKPFRLVHRLDKDTSGVLLVAKSLEMAAHLALAFKTNKVKKIYWAIVKDIPNPPQAVINAPITKDTEREKEKMVVDFKNGKPSKTHYRLIKALGRQAAWLELKPETGRTHQLRVHTAYMGHPILGDGKYGSADDNLPLHLHARAITFPDLEGHMLTFTAPLAEHIERTLITYRINWENYT